MALPIVAVVGRPNVGKSTFVNRIAQADEAIVHEMRGVTRDRSYHIADWNGVPFKLIDTGGIEMGDDDAFQSSIRTQAFAGVNEADVIVFIVDGRTGINADDERMEVTTVAPTPAVQDDLAASESQISRVLIVAQQSADKLVADARDNAERIRNEADQKAREVIRQALAEKQNELDEIDRLKQSREDFRNEYKKLLQHFMDDADSVFPQQPLSTAPNGSGAAPAATPAARPAVSAPAVPGASAGSTAAGNASFQTDFGDLD